jgi:mono/diheme cytochrome c family protein
MGDGPEAKYFVPPPANLRGGVLDRFSEDQIVTRLRDAAPRLLALDPQTLPARLQQLDDVTAHIRRLPSIDWKKVDAGEAIFDQRCAACHGPLGQPLPAAALPPGVQKQPRNLWDPVVQRDTSDSEMLEAIQHGRRAMPAIPHLRDEHQAKALLPFIRILTPGFATYSYYCAACHGDEGRGDGALASGENKPTFAFDREWIDHRTDTQLQSGVAHMLSEHRPVMPHFRGRMTDEQLREIVRYLKRSD